MKETVLMILSMVAALPAYVALVYVLFVMGLRILGLGNAVHN